MTFPRIAAFATKGSWTNEELRLRELLKNFPVEFLQFNKAAKRRGFADLLASLYRMRPELVVMEGTGLAGGLACMLARILLGTRYVVSSGDAVGPIIGSHSPIAGPFFAAYERLLCRLSAGFIGWTPYLAGRALTFGAPRAMTAPGWSLFTRSADEAAAARLRIRDALGIPSDALVVGIVGALVWSKPRGYCYGLELVRAALRVARDDLRMLIVGGGDGLDRLRAIAGERVGKDILLIGQVPLESVPDYMCAMDVGSLPQSCDGVGSFRYTTKISEYLAASVPVVTGQIPLAYDLDDGWLWRLPGDAPWSDRYVSALADFMRTVTPAEVQAKSAATQRNPGLFDKNRQIRSVTAFVEDLLWRAESPRNLLVPRPSSEQEVSAEAFPSTPKSSVSVARTLQ
jgi:glycosyltransferase involved in cell wall biosynthesis